MRSKASLKENRTRFAKGLLIAVATYAGVTALLVPVMGKIVLNGTASIDAFVFWKTPGRAIAKNDYVLAPARHPLIPRQYEHLTKHALCLPGEWLTFSGTAFSCNGVHLHTVKIETKKGVPLERFEWEAGVVPEGKAFIGSRHPDGFDSRYLGFFDLDELVRLEALI
ncbi:MAG: S26 family signal peptidase [Pseudomonadota bacterium]